MSEDFEYVPRRVGRPPIPEATIIMILKLRIDDKKSYRAISKELSVSHETCRRYCIDTELMGRYRLKQAPASAK